jgi:hypothetical protein
MEFDEMKEVWGAQNNQPPYVIDEKALRNSLKRKTLSVVVSISDWVSIISYLVACYLLVGRNAFKPGSNIFLSLEASWMFVIAVYFVVSFIRRIKSGRRFDRSIHGDLDHSISIVSYQMRNCRMFLWNIPPMGVIMIFSGWVSGKFFLVSAVILVSNTLAFYAVSKGLRMNKRRKRALQALKEKLESSSV